MNQPKRKPVKAKPDDAAQSRAFIDKARELEADEDKSAADAVMGRLGKMEHAPHKKRSSS